MADLFICGDIANYYNEEGMLCSDELAELVASADCSVCNFEAPISGFGTPRPKSGPHKAQLPKTVDGLKKQGFNVLLLANNHIMDYGPDGLGATMERISRTGLACLGAGPDSDSAYVPLIRTIGGLKIGMINACEAQFGVLDLFAGDQQAGYAWIHHPRIDTTILSLRSQCDFVIVFAHAGLEYYPVPQKEWRARYRHFCDLGADAVIGSHPHVPQGYEWHGESLICYSLGNFSFDRRKFRSDENRSYAAWLALEKGRPPQFKPVFHYTSEGKVRIAPKEKQVDLEHLCMLLGESYSHEQDKMSLEAYEKIRKKLLLSLLPVPYDGSVWSMARQMAHNLLKWKKQKDKSIQLLHLFRNEAYYYAARHSLELMAKDRDDA